MIRDDIVFKAFVAGNIDSNPNCVACKPGYKPIVDQVNTKMINSCQKIEKCSENGKNTFNKCTQCEEGYFLNETDDDCIAT